MEGGLVAIESLSKHGVGLQMARLRRPQGGRGTAARREVFLQCPEANGGL